MAKYFKNLETGKFHIKFDKIEWKNLSFPNQTLVKRYCLWSRTQACWITKGKDEPLHIIKNLEQEISIEKDVPVGEKISFEEQMEVKKEKESYRIERAEVLSEKFEKQSNEVYAEAKKLGSVIPFGQPILVGHHSEKRDRNYRAKIVGKYEKSFELADKAKYFQEKSNKYTLDEKEKDPVYLRNRLDENTKRLKNNPNSIEAKEKLQYYTEKLEQLKQEGIIFDRDSLKGITHVKCRGTWYPLKRINIKTITIGNWLGIPHFTWQYPFEEIQAVKIEKEEMPVLDNPCSEVSLKVENSNLI